MDCRNETETLGQRCLFLSWYCLWRAGKRHMDQREHSQCFTSLICCKCMLVCKWLRSVSQFDLEVLLNTCLSKNSFYSHLNLRLAKLETRVKSLSLRWDWSVFAPDWHNMVLTLATGVATALTSSSGKKKINCPEARSVHFHTLSPISLKVEVLNRIKPGQCTMELCTKWHSYVKRQLLGNIGKEGKL